MNNEKPQSNRHCRVQAAKRRREQRGAARDEREARSIRFKIQKRIVEFCGKYNILWSWLRKPDWKLNPAFALWTKCNSSEKRPDFIEAQKALIQGFVDHLSMTFKVALGSHENTRGNWMAFNITLA
ncbi:MAG: hypothetical protein WC763_04995 [Candidatus Paceibacterota bacterium]|jgi:hypothetical protein